MTTTNIISNMHFIGDYNPNLYYNYGAICTRQGELWQFDGTVWHQITEIEDKVYSEVEIIHYTTNCPNCGAPMKNHKCVYCGTEDYGRR